MKTFITEMIRISILVVLFDDEEVKVIDLTSGEIIPEEILSAPSNSTLWKWISSSMEWRSIWYGFRAGEKL